MPMTHRSVLVLIQSVVIVFGTLAAALSYKFWPDILGEDAAQLGPMKFLAYYGWTLFLVPLLWLALTEACKRVPRITEHYHWAMFCGWALIPTLVWVFVTNCWVHVTWGLAP